jgi:hypothetical protein
VTVRSPGHGRYLAAIFPWQGLNDGQNVQIRTPRTLLKFREVCFHARPRLPTLPPHFARSPSPTAKRLTLTEGKVLVSVSPPSALIVHLCVPVTSDRDPSHVTCHAPPGHNDDTNSGNVPPFGLEMNVDGHCKSGPKGKRDGKWE